MNNNIPRVIRYYWDGKLTSNRIKHLNTMQNKSGVPLEKMCAKNMIKYQVPEHPIHPGFFYLSAPHKSDYARAYVTYHYGGGYSDIKNCSEDWNKYFDELEKSDKDGIGTRRVENINGKLTTFPKTDSHYNFISVSLFIFKKHSPLLKLWIDYLNKILEKNLDKLKKYPGRVHPYVSADAWRYNWVPDKLIKYPYPLNWVQLSCVFYDLQSILPNTTIIRMYEPQTCENGHPYR